MGYLDSNAMSNFKLNQANSQQAARDQLAMQRAAFGSAGGAQGNQQWTGGNPILQGQLNATQMQANDPVAFNRLMAQRQASTHMPVLNRSPRLAQQGSEVFGGGGRGGGGNYKSGFGISYAQGGPTSTFTPPAPTVPGYAPGVMRLGNNPFV